jgi:hypothetical protein
MEIIQSKKELERKKRDSEIVSLYAELLNQYPTAKPWRILRTIGEKYDLTPEGVRNILMSMGAYVPQSKSTDEEE